MHFKHPELLYFLLLLVIPILVHLFQLRRFKKEYFTNVRFLKELSIQTRKSSKIKKWLLLATRLLLLFFLIIAFAQPYFEAIDHKNNKNELYIVLDNSFSMQAKGANGPLLKRAIQDLLEHTPENTNFSIITNNETFWNTDIKSIQRDLQQLKYSALPFDLESAVAKINSRKSFVKKDVLFVTDAQNISQNGLKSINNELNPLFVIPKSEQKNNISIDSVFVKKAKENLYEIGVSFKEYGENKNPISVALHQDKKLIAKALYTPSTKQKTISFTIPKSDFKGYVSIIDGGLEYDNNYFFSISKPKKINVLSVGSSEKNEFLNRIYTADEFDFFQSELKNLNYNQIEKQDVIVLNELESIPEALQTTLKSFYEKGGNIIYIPSELCSVANQNQFLTKFASLSMVNIQEKTKLISKIAFQHPLFQSVFEKKVENFQYPSAKKTFGIRSKSPAILSFEDQSVFLTGTKNPIDAWFYIFTAPLNKVNTNFQQAPLIVPTFYKMGLPTQKMGVNAYAIGSNQSAIIDVNLGKDEILTLKNNAESFVPVQQALSNKVKISFNDYPEQAGNFDLFKKNDYLKSLSFNYARTESNVNNEPTSALDAFEIMPNIETVFNTLHTQRTDSEVWKWFVILTLFFLLAEILIQKFVK